MRVNLGQSYLPGEGGSVITVPSYAPGLPEGYNPQTGTIAASNTTGATQSPAISQSTLNAALDLVPSAFANEAVQMQLANADAYLNANTVNCPSGWTCSYISGVPDLFLYAGAGLFGLILFAAAMGGGGRRR